MKPGALITRWALAAAVSAGSGSVSRNRPRRDSWPVPTIVHVVPPSPAIGVRVISVIRPVKRGAASTVTAITWAIPIARPVGSVSTSSIVVVAGSIPSSWRVRPDRIVTSAITRAGSISIPFITTATA